MAVQTKVYERVRNLYFLPASLYFEILGVSPGASVQDIRVAFMTRSREYHPDRAAHWGKNLRRAADEGIQQIDLAYEVLKDPHPRLGHVRRLGTV